MNNISRIRELENFHNALLVLLFSNSLILEKRKINITKYILLFENLLEAGVQGFATQCTVGDLALRIDKDVIGDGINHIS